MSSMSLSSNQKNELLFMGFNQDYGRFRVPPYFVTDKQILRKASIQSYSPHGVEKNA